MSRARKWMITENARPEQLRDELEEIFKREKDIRYICGQLEKGSNLHFQGYVQLSKAQRMTWLKKRISHTANYQAQAAPRNDQARDYCMKEDETTISDTFVEFGSYIKGRGSRTDVQKAVEDFKDAIKSGNTQRQLVETHLYPMAKFPRLYGKLRSLFKPTRHKDSEFKVSLYYGEPGSGKTRKANEDYPELYEMPLQTGSTLWMDGYDLHETVLLDDFSGKMSKTSLVNTLKLLDRYPIQVAEKGGFVWWMPDHIIITTNIHPRGWYVWQNREVHWEALKRRIHEVLLFEKDVEPTSIDPEIFLEDATLWPQPYSRMYPA